MTEARTDPVVYYASHSPLTDPRHHADLLQDLPSDLPNLCWVTQGLVLHGGMAHLYRLALSPERQQEATLRTMAAILSRIRALDPRPLVVARSPEKRLVGSCRVQALLLCALLREQGVSARVRFGFSGYFAPGFYGDHELCEYWQANQQRWVLVDPELDNAELEEILRRMGQPFTVAFNPRDVPRDQFLAAGKAWQLCRAGEADATRFGFDPDHSGMRYIRRQLVRDLAALNKLEVEAEWGFGATDDADLTHEDIALLDQVALLTQAGNESFAALQTTYLLDTHLRIPPSLWEPDQER